MSLGFKVCKPILLLKLSETPVVGSIAIILAFGGVKSCKKFGATEDAIVNWYCGVLK